uniref:Uncharacterized protein n=1 Tax=Setaria italica TaxID=4555 RepID=K3ZZ12_SETIT
MTHDANKQCKMILTQKFPCGFSLNKPLDYTWITLLDNKFTNNHKKQFEETVS